jgi:hypothetical protein
MRERCFQVNYYVPFEPVSDGFEHSQDFYCEAASDIEALDKLLAEEPFAAGATTKEITEVEFRFNIE